MLTQRLALVLTTYPTPGGGRGLPSASPPLAAAALAQVTLVTPAAPQQQHQMAAVTHGPPHGRQHASGQPSSAHTARGQETMMFVAGVLWVAVALPSAWGAGRAALAPHGRARGQGSTSSWCSSEWIRANRA
jgi:hypothetical protein